jgi:hypothetical protein
MTESGDIRERRKRLRDEYRDLYDRVSAILFDEDLVGINLGDNTDEYEPEVDRILPRLGSCSSVESVQHVVCEVFAEMFTQDIRWKPEVFRGVAVRIWALLP